MINNSYTVSSSNNELIGNLIIINNNKHIIRRPEPRPEPKCSISNHNNVGDIFKLHPMDIGRGETSLFLLLLFPCKKNCCSIWTHFSRDKDASVAQKNSI